MSALSDADLAAFDRFRIPRELLESAGIVRVTDLEARERLGARRPGDLSGILFPGFHPKTGDSRNYRVRRDHPEIEDGKPKNKYVASQDRQSLYFAPGGGSLLSHRSIPVVFVEAEKSCLALTAAAHRANRPCLVVATRGCWGFRGRTGKTIDATGERVDEVGIVADFDLFEWTDRDVTLVPDTNIAVNRSVQAANHALASELIRRGARLRTAILPSQLGVNGPDDFVAAYSDTELFALLDSAKPGAFKTAKQRPTKPKQGRGVRLEDPEPWHEPVDGAALLDALAAVFERYLALPQHASTVLALWVLHTYAMEAAFTSPILAITSPVKQCGKTLLLIVLGAIVARRLFASNVTPAALFRTVEQYTPTLLIDEADTFLRDNDELRGVLNSGHTRTTATVIRTAGDDHEPRQFSTWCAKAIALIGRLHGTLADRAIEVPMRRRMTGETIERLRQDRIETECEHLRRQAVRWTVDSVELLKQADPVIPAGLNDRAGDCYRPLLAIADAAGGLWPERAREAALALSIEKAESDASVLLLQDIQQIFSNAGDRQELTTREILEQLHGLEDRPWSEFSNGRPLSSNRLARLLKAFDVHPAGTMRIGSRTAKGYRRSAFEDAWARYLPSLQPTPHTSQRNNRGITKQDTRIAFSNEGEGCDDSPVVTIVDPTESSDALTASTWDRQVSEIVDYFSGS